MTATFNTIDKQLESDTLNTQLLPTNSSLTTNTFNTSSSINTIATTSMKKQNVIAMVGLPARGKTYISRQIVKFLTDRGYEAAIFNVGEYRRLSTDYAAHDFFSSQNEAAMDMRNAFAIAALEDLCTWLSKGDNNSRVAIYDATNSTRERRDIIHQTVVNKYKHNLLFVESICNKQNIIDVNIRHKTKSHDYISFESKEAAMDDFKLRILHYQERYLPLGVQLEENRYSFIQIINAGESWHLHRCKNPVQILVTHFLIDLYKLAPIQTTTTSSTTITKQQQKQLQQQQQHQQQQQETSVQI